MVSKRRHKNILEKTNMEEVKEEKILSKKEIRRRKKLGELFEKRRRKGHEKWVRKIRREAAKTEQKPQDGEEQ